MKNFLTSLLVLFVIGCQEHLESNTPAFQGQKNGEFLWKSTTSTAIIDAEGALTLTGSDGFGKMTLKVPSVDLGTFVLGVDATALATYTEDGDMFSTNNSGNASLVYVSDGAISIDEYDVDARTITASYYFNAYTVNGERGLNFSEGVIYKLPVTTVTP
tara:strand:- start:6474 stop:6950 length:477 start_codon:yes stop_codon:yes gene_type:complete